MTVTVGIDLGTSNSAIAISRLSVEVLPNAEGNLITPSCVTALRRGDALAFTVGDAARDLRKQHPRETVLSVKRLMGRDFDDKEMRDLRAHGRVGYAMVPAASGSGAAHVSLHDTVLSPEEISAEILKKLVADAARSPGTDITDAVVTVPAYFSDRQKFATRLACEKANLRLVRLLPEPTAAALSFGVREMDSREGRTIMVFDLGGGTFDISILGVVEGQFMEITKGGDMWLGGDDIDRAIRDFVYAATERENAGLDLAAAIDRLDPVTRSRFEVEALEACERAKIALSSQDTADVELFGTLRDEKGKLIDIEVEVSRADIDEILAPLNEKLLGITRKVLTDVGFTVDLIDMVVMVGGSSLIPCVQESLKGLFGTNKVHVHPRPLHAVVEGAAIMAQVLAGTTARESTGQTDINLMHSTAHSYHLLLANGKRCELVGRNAPLPAHAEETLTLPNPRQALARLRVMNEVDGILEPVAELWAFRLKTDDLLEVASLIDLLAADKKPVSFQLRFEVDEDNIIRMDTSLGSEAGTGFMVRDASAISLFQELEAVLAAGIPQCPVEVSSYDFIGLARVVVNGIMEIPSLPEGEQRQNKIRAVREQIDTLDALFDEETWFPLADLNALRDYLAFAPGAFSPEKAAEAARRIAETRELLLALSDVCAIVEALKGLEEFTDSCGELYVAFVQGQNLARCYPQDSRKVLDHVAACALARSLDQPAVAESHLDSIWRILQQYVPDDDALESRFDRDVNLARGI